MTLRAYPRTMLEVSSGRESLNNQAVLGRAVNLPPDIEAIAKEKAAVAGLPDVGSFVERLIENAPPEQALLPPPSDPRIIAAINAGFESSVEGEMDDAFWKRRSDKLDTHIAAKHDSNA